MIETRREIWQKEEERTKRRREDNETRTHYLSVGMQRIDHDIRVVGHNMLLRKAIRAISVDHPRDM